MKKLHDIFNLNSLQTLFRHAIYFMLVCIVVAALHNASLMNFYEEDILIIIYIIVGAVAFGLAIVRILKFDNKTPKAECLATKIFSVVAYMASAVIICILITVPEIISEAQNAYNTADNQHAKIIFLITAVIICALCYLFAFRTIKSMIVRVLNSVFLLCALFVLSIVFAFVGDKILLSPSKLSESVTLIIVIIAFVLPLLVLFFLSGRKSYDLITKEYFDRERFKNIQDSLDLFGLTYLVFLWFSIVSIIYFIYGWAGVYFAIYCILSLICIMPQYFVFYWIYYFVYKRAIKKKNS